MLEVTRPSHSLTHAHTHHELDIWTFEHFVIVQALTFIMLAALSECPHWERAIVYERGQAPACRSRAPIVELKLKTL